MDRETQLSCGPRTCCAASLRASLETTEDNQPCQPKPLTYWPTSIGTGQNHSQSQNAQRSANFLKIKLHSAFAVEAGPSGRIKTRGALPLSTCNGLFAYSAHRACRTPAPLIPWGGPNPRREAFCNFFYSLLLYLDSPAHATRQSALWAACHVRSNKMNLTCLRRLLQLLKTSQNC